MISRMFRTNAWGWVFAGALTVLGPVADAATLSGPALAKALRHGGQVVVMRHASSPAAPPAPDRADAANTTRERQLDEAGKTAAAAMGAAIKALHIRVGAVWSSPTYRALQTVRLAGLPDPKTAPELGDRGASMTAANDDQASWLRAKAAEAPRPGTDTFIVTHSPNMAAAFKDDARGLGDGEALVLRPKGDGSAELVGRIRMDEWPQLARQGGRDGVRRGPSQAH